MPQCRTLLVIACSLLASVGCSPNEVVEVPQDQDGLSSGGVLVDTGGIHNEPDVPIDTGADVDPDKLKSHQSCAQVLQCASELCKVTPGAGCDKLCVQDASAAASASYALYGQCRNALCAGVVCKGSDDPACVDTCLLQRCSTLLFRCNLEAKAADKPCSNMVACHKTCADAAKARKKEGKPSAEYACLNTCYGTLTGQAQDTYDDWAACFAMSGASDRYAACLPELLACGGDGQPVGSQSCREIAQCTDVCGQQTGKAHDYQSCLGACFGQGSMLGKMGWVGHLRCLSDLAEGKADAPKCAATLVSCASAEGTQSCQQVRSCADKCLLEGGPACHLSCMAQADDAGAVQYGAVRWCDLTHCETKCKGQAVCRAGCLQEHCATELAACKGSLTP